MNITVHIARDAQTNGFQSNRDTDNIERLLTERQLGSAATQREQRHFTAQNRDRQKLPTFVLPSNDTAQHGRGNSPARRQLEINWLTLYARQNHTCAPMSYAGHRQSTCSMIRNMFGREHHNAPLHYTGFARRNSPSLTTAKPACCSADPATERLAGSPLIS